MSLLIKFITLFSGLGLTISLAFGFIVQNRVSHVLFVAFICTLLSAALGLAVYKILEARVPEFLDLFRGGFAYEEDFDGSEGMFDSSSFEEGDAEQVTDFDKVVSEKTDTKAFGDHILVNKMKIKNEPKLIAKAISTMLARDS